MGCSSQLAMPLQGGPFSNWDGVDQQFASFQMQHTIVEYKIQIQIQKPNTIANTLPVHSQIGMGKI